MNILLISECSKRALSETRRILDQFAERRGERTWQTPITQQGLDTLHRLLRKTARRNTAVACHLIRGKDHSELLWVVGDASRFNPQGAVPTNSTERNVLRREDENDWHTGEDIRLLTALAALFHDLGKASLAFQNKLAPRHARTPVADAYRHEWVSLRLFEAFVGGSSDEEWLQHLVDLPDKPDDQWLQNLQADGLVKLPRSPFNKLPPLARAVGWLILSHHRLPASHDGKAGVRPELLAKLPSQLSAAWCGARGEATAKEIQACWTFKKGLPFASAHWRSHVRRIASSLLARHGVLATDWCDNPYAMHVARLVLMLADHFYSSQPSHARYGDKGFSLHANTDRETGELKQRLDEHLIGVKVNASRILRSLPRLADNLPRIARHKGFRRRSADPRFRWQDKAYDLAAGLQRRSAEQGFFGVNMASTGCGKTLANGRILYALADPQRGARFCLALGLRSLTLQTGDAYRQRLGLGPEDMAVLVGGGATRQLHDPLAGTGSESAGDLLPENSFVHFEGSLEDGPLNRWLQRSPDAQKLLNAPILACTIDHLMPATEGVRGGRQIPAMLRLLTSDLVLDEPDDFDLADLYGLSRLVHWAGLLGSRVLLSSATLPPALVQGLFEAYAAGRRLFQQNRGIPGTAPEICCAWFDEFAVNAVPCADGKAFMQEHRSFVDKRLAALAAKAEVRRQAIVRPLPLGRGSRQELCRELAGELLGQALELHAQHHTPDPRTGKRVSFGLIRMANIDPLLDTVQALYALDAPPSVRIHLCCYHAQHPLLVRSGIEQQLDRLLNRQRPDALFADPKLCQSLDKSDEADQVFVVLATAVAEVGRDHDYDWGIVEPSSMRSIIQLAGRIRRHRPGNCRTPNLHLLDSNIKALSSGPDRPAFCRPGFESEDFLLNSHRLSELLTAEQLAVIDASTRIRERPELQPHDNLIDLEHARLQVQMLGQETQGEFLATPADWWWQWQSRAALSGELQRCHPFRDDPQGRQRYGLLPDDDGEIQFYRYEQQAAPTPANSLLQPLGATPGRGMAFWGEPDYQAALEALAKRLDLEPRYCAERFGYIDLPARGAEQGWRYHPALGFGRYLP
ncbi:type I-F CRISPR-associated helicase Cas3f [Azotobacter armeniacus]